MSRWLAVGALVVLLVLAGCGEQPVEATATTDSTASGERVIAAPPSANETTGTTAGTTVAITRTTAATTTPTTTEVYNQGLSYEVGVSNANQKPKNVTVVITPGNESAPFFERSMRLSPNESREFDFEFPRVGAYEVTVRVGDETLTRRWEVGVRDPDHAFTVYVAVDGEVHAGLEAI